MNNESNGSILIVDDEINNLQLLSELLFQNQYKVRAAKTARSALSSIESEMPDLLLLDIKLPDMDGYDVCKRIKSTEKLKDLPILFLSALDNTADIIRGFEVGGVDFITKPFKTEEVLARVKTHIQLKQLRDKYEKQAIELRITNENLEKEIAASKQVEYIRQKNQELKELNATKDKFFSIIAHDLRSPLSGFISLTKMMLENYSDLPKDNAHKLISVMHDTADKLYRLSENLLSWATLQKDTINFIPENCNLSKIVIQNVEIMSNLINQKNITLTTHISNDIIVFADHSMLDSIIRNLISNAIKFTKKNGTIDIYASDAENKIQLSVQDSGIGISANMLDNLFKIDQKTFRKGTDGEASSGLGLILCKEFITKNNGSIWVESEIGKGSIFYITLPKPENSI